MLDTYLIDTLTEEEIRVKITALQRAAAEGKLTPEEADRLMRLRAALDRIQRAKRGLW